MSADERIELLAFRALVLVRIVVAVVDAVALEQHVDAPAVFAAEHTWSALAGLARFVLVRAIVAVRLKNKVSDI